MHSQPLTKRIQHALRPPRQGFSTLGLLALAAAGLGMSGVLASAVLNRTGFSGELLT